MKISDPTPQLTLAASAFAALGSEQRLAIVKRLVKAGPSGLAMADLGEAVGITGSVLTHHLKQLVAAGLVRQVRDGRRILSSVDFEAVREVSDFIIQECCADGGSVDTNASTGASHG
ncbi:MAG: metalloregulator ArsR/SmtB family transcription factor [Pseudomonadota bacterium]